MADVTLQYRTIKLYKFTNDEEVPLIHMKVQDSALPYPAKKTIDYKARTSSEVLAIDLEYVTQSVYILPELVWMSMDTFSQFTQIHDIMQTNAGAFLIGTAPTSGIYKSDDNGLTWTVQGALEAQIWQIIETAAFDLYAATGTNGVIAKSVDGGITWIPVGAIPVPSAVGIVEAVDTSLVVTGSGTTVYNSVDGGVTWNPVVGVLPGASGLFIFKDSLNDLYIGCLTSSVIFKSVNNGLNWALVGTVVGETTVDCMAEDSLGNLYAGATPSGILWTSPDKGINWVPLYDFSAHGDRVRRVVITPTNRIFVAVDVAGLPGKILESVDGIVWNVVHTLSGTDYVDSLLFAADNRVYAGVVAAGGLTYVLRSPLSS